MLSLYKFDYLHDRERVWRTSVGMRQRGEHSSEARTDIVTRNDGDARNAQIDHRNIVRGFNLQSPQPHIHLQHTRTLCML